MGFTTPDSHWGDRGYLWLVRLLIILVFLDCGVADASRRYNLTWIDRLNLENLTLVSRAIAAAADFCRDSRGAHFREDFPQVSDLASSRYTCVRLAGNKPAVESEPVTFTRVRPGQSLLRQGPATAAL